MHGKSGRYVPPHLRIYVEKLEGEILIKTEQSAVIGVNREIVIR